MSVLENLFLQAVLDYTNVSRRWSMPGRYYTKVFEKKGTAIRFVMIDTAPLIDKYRNESETYPDACKQDMDQQLEEARIRYIRNRWWGV